MKLSALVLHRVRIPFRMAFGHAAAVRECSDSAVIRLVAEDGTEGLGESAPREYVTGETWESVRRDLQEKGDKATRLLVERDPIAALREGLPRLIERNAARCAFELAALDLISKSGGRTIPDLLGREALPRFRPRYSGVIGSGARWKIVISALKMRLYGFRDVKIKVGLSREEDLGAAQAARWVLGKRTDIRADANGAWRLEEAEERLRDLAPFGLSCIEQPLPKGREQELPLLRRRTQVPIMLDESLCTMEDAVRAAEGGECDAFNIRLSKCGGLMASLDLADYARRHGIRCQLGCQVGETGILSAAGRLFSLLVPDLIHLEGSYERHLLSDDITRERVRFGYGGWADPLPGPGLGVSIRPAALKKYSEHIAEIECGA